MNIVIPAAGAGSRFKPLYKEPKPYIKVDGMSMIALAVKTLDLDGTYHYILPKHNLTEDVMHELRNITPNCTFLVIDYVTEGAVQSVLLLEELINNDDELVIANCDQVMRWASADALGRLRNFDGGLVTILDNNPKHSYALIENNLVTKVVEKEVISNNALTGIHYWKQGKDFVNAGTKMMAENNRSLNEFYISATYNYLINDGLTVGDYMIDDEEIAFIGTPEDLEKYNGSN
jgi:NDP-sugar pyrophosphorylase family protein